MDRPEFKAMLSKNTLNYIDEVFSEANPRKALLLKTAADVFTEDEVSLFEELIECHGFRKYLKSRKRISSSRLENSLHILFRRTASGIKPDIIADIAAGMTEPEYRAIERSFFKPPVDRESYELFEKGFVMVGEQDLILLGEYCEFCYSEEFVYFKSDYRSDYELYEDMFYRLIDLLLAKKSSVAVRQYAELLIRKSLMRFIDAGRYQNDLSKFIPLLFDVFYYHSDPHVFFAMLDIYSKRYPRISSEDMAEKDAHLYKRLFSLWPHFYYAGTCDKKYRDEFREFIADYGNSRKEFERFVWNTVFELEPEKACRAMTILNSTAFSSLRGFYSNDDKTVKFLVRNIITVISEMEVRDIGNSLYTIVLKLLLGLKISKSFLKRRADFFAWMKERTDSVLLEIEVIRFLFFEYIYIALKIVPNESDLRMTKYCDMHHRYFCSMIDDIYSNKLFLRRNPGFDPFENLLKYLRKIIWKDMYEKFGDKVYQLEEVKSIAEATGREDQVIAELDNVEPEFFGFYHESLVDVFRTDPDQVAVAVASDYWCRITLNQALTYCHGVLIPLVGTIQINESERSAYTSGKEIFLPAYISYFRDAPEPLIENRNLTVYIGLTIHEAGHIIAGSYHFNIFTCLNKVERPDLLKQIWNCFEDFRIEKFMISINAHPQAEDILFTLNEYYSVSMSKEFLPAGSRFVIYIFDEAGGYNRELKKDADYCSMIDQLLSRDLNTGRFRGLRELAEYGVQRLKSVDISNPLGVYPLTREFYEIMKHWPESDLEGMLEPRFQRGFNSIPESDDGEGRNRPLSRDELDELYRQYNENPRAFLEANDLPVFTSLLPGNEEGEEKSSQGDRQSDGYRNPGIDEFIERVVDYSSEYNYEDSGTIDFSTRTAADDEAAERQKSEDNSVKKKGRSKGKKKKSGDNNSKKKYVYSINPRTGSRTRLSEIYEFDMKGRDAGFMRKFHKWESLAAVVQRQLAFMLPVIDERYDTSHEEGEMNMELLLEVLCDRDSSQVMPEIFDIYTEKRRSLEVVIGLDASGSTAINIDGNFSEESDTILDIEKAFAMIFARALSHLTERVSVCAFNSVTSTNIYNAHDIDSVSLFKPDASNRDGDFIRYIKNRFEKSDAEVKYFFMLSDGQPAADNYNGKEALDDTLIAMRECVNAGVSLFYFNFDSIKSDYFDAFSNEATWARYFTSPTEILPAIPDLVSTVINSIV